jgi:hypothetical protein
MHVNSLGLNTIYILLILVNMYYFHTKRHLLYIVLVKFNVKMSVFGIDIYIEYS